MSVFTKSGPMWTALLCCLLIAFPASESRRLLDVQDLHPDEPGNLPNPEDPSVQASEAEFSNDMNKATDVQAIENSNVPAGQELSVVGEGSAEGGESKEPSEVAEDMKSGADEASAIASEVEGSEGAAATDASAEVPAESAVAAEETAVSAEGSAAEGVEVPAGEAGEDADWGWDAYDEPDADTWFYDADENLNEDAGWTWNDAIDAEGDNNWDTEWLPAERDDSFSGRVNATWNAMMTHVVPGVDSLGETATGGKALVKAGVSTVLNIEDHPKNQMLLEVLTFLPMLPPVLLILFLIRAASQTLTMYNLVQFACFFCGAYSGLLIVAAWLTGDEPLAAFQFMAGHGAYIKYQFLVATAYVLFLMLLYVNVCVQRCGSMALIQQVLGTTIGLHYYLGTFHPAMIALPPESVVGLSVGVPTYFFYMTVFFIMGVLPQRNKAIAEEEEDDKVYGEGKGQD